MATKKKTGRPTSYLPEVADDICSLISSGESVLQISKRPGMPGSSTIYRWLSEHEEFWDKYRRAREAQADYYADEIVNIADGCVPDAAEVAKAKLRIDARKWYVTKVAPRKYADKLVQDVALQTTNENTQPRGLNDYYATNGQPKSQPGAKAVLDDEGTE